MGSLYRPLNARGAAAAFALAKLRPLAKDAALVITQARTSLPPALRRYIPANGGLANHAGAAKDFPIARTGFK